VRVAMGQVEQAAAAAAAGRVTPWAVLLRERLVRLLDAFDHHIQVTEASGGLLEEVVDAAPRLANRAAQLRSDHVVIHGSIEEAIAELQRPESLNETGVSQVRDVVLDLLRQIGHHRHLGADLVYQAYNVDIEATD
jgi:UDP-N-acetylmuramyl tripeptide synthase